MVQAFDGGRSPVERASESCYTAKRSRLKSQLRSENETPSDATTVPEEGEALLKSEEVLKKQLELLCLCLTT